MIPVNIDNPNYQDDSSDEEEEDLGNSSDSDGYHVVNTITDNEIGDLTEQEMKRRQEHSAAIEKQLQSVGIGYTKEMQKTELKKVLAKLILPYIKFAVDEQLQSDGEIAQVAFSHLNQIPDRKITDETWKKNWKLISRLLKQEMSKYHAYRSSQLGRILIGK